MLYINWVYKGSVVVSKSIALDTSNRTMNILQHSIEIALRYKTPRLCTSYAKPENFERFFISTNDRLNEWVG